MADREIAEESKTAKNVPGLADENDEVIECGCDQWYCLTCSEDRR